MRRVEFTRLAASQAFDASTWWYQQREKAPDAFDAELESAARLLASSAASVGVRIQQRPGVRRLYLKRVRYFVYFEVVSDDLVLIVAVWHGNRLPPEM